MSIMLLTLLFMRKLLSLNATISIFLSIGIIVIHCFLEALDCRSQVSTQCT